MTQLLTHSIHLSWWCSGYHVRFTRGRSWVQTPPRTIYLCSMANAIRLCSTKKVDEKGIDPLASRMLSERSTTELHTRMFGVYGIFKVELNTPSINECQPCLGSIVVVRLIRNQKVVGSIPTRGFFVRHKNPASTSHGRKHRNAR